MKLEDIKHKKNFSPVLGRALLGNMPLQMFCKYILIQDYEDYKGETSIYSEFFLEVVKCFKNYKRLYKIISEIREKMKYPLTFGFKIHPGGLYKFELYFYYSYRKIHKFKKEDMVNDYNILMEVLKENGYTKNLSSLIKDTKQELSTIWSFDFYDTDEFFGEKINFYTQNKTGPDHVIFWGDQYTKSLKGVEKEGLFFIFNKKYDLDLVRDLKYNFSSSQIKSALEILNKYNCKEYGVCNKSEEDGSVILYVQYYGVTDKDFENFLINNHYPKSLVKHYQDNKIKYEEMIKDVTEVYRIKKDGFELFRWGIYGMI
jgi:hypothetical protein